MASDFPPKKAIHQVASLLLKEHHSHSLSAALGDTSANIIQQREHTSLKDFLIYNELEAILILNMGNVNDTVKNRQQRSSV